MYIGNWVKHIFLNIFWDMFLYSIRKLTNLPQNQALLYAFSDLPTTQYDPIISIVPRFAT